MFTAEIYNNSFKWCIFNPGIVCFIDINLKINCLIFDNFLVSIAYYFISKYVVLLQRLKIKNTYMHSPTIIKWACSLILVVELPTIHLHRCSPMI